MRESSKCILKRDYPSQNCYFSAMSCFHMPLHILYFKFSQSVTILLFPARHMHRSHAINHACARDMQIKLRCSCPGNRKSWHCTHPCQFGSSMEDECTLVFSISLIGSDNQWIILRLPVQPSFVNKQG